MCHHLSKCVRRRLFIVRLFKETNGYCGVVFFFYGSAPLVKVQSMCYIDLKKRQAKLFQSCMYDNHNCLF